MGADVHTVGQSAHHEHLGAPLAQFGHEAAYEVLSVDGASARAYDTHHTACVEVGRAFVVEHQGCVVTLLEALRVVVIGQGEDTDAVFPGIRLLGLGLLQPGSDALEGFHHAGSGIGHTVGQILAVLHDVGGVSHGIVEVACLGQVEELLARQCHGA